MTHRAKFLLYRNQSLTSLDLSHNKLGDKGGMLVAQALADVHLSRLETLILRANQLGPETAFVLAASLSVNQRSHLAKLDICDNPLGTEGWGAIWEALRDARESQLSHWDLYKQVHQISIDNHEHVSESETWMLPGQLGIILRIARRAHRSAPIT